MAASSAEDDDKNWVGGDGGPLVVLQSSAAVQWQGALGSEDDLSGDDSVIEIDAESAHLYVPGEVAFENDNDAAFLCGDYVTRRYGRDMLVLDDSEWSGRLFLLPSGAVGVVQVQCRVENLPDAVSRAAQAEPEKSGPFHVQDGTLRLLVGADSGDGSVYGYSEVPVSPGVKRWSLHPFEYGSVFLLSDRGAG